MAKQRKQKAAQISSPRSEELPEDEQWRIIEQTGLLKEVPQERRSNSTGTASSVQKRKDDSKQDSNDEPFSPLCNEIFNTTLFLMPFSSLYIMMDILAHRQYAQEITTAGILEKVIYGIPFLYSFIFYTLRYKDDQRMQALLFVLSVVCGARLVYIVNWASWRVVVNQCASLGTIWVYTVAQLNLIPAVGALAVVAAYVKWKDLKIIF